jgi:hypothetical protein
MANTAIPAWRNSVRNLLAGSKIRDGAGQLQPATGHQSRHRQQQMLVIVPDKLSNALGEITQEGSS